MVKHLGASFILSGGLLTLTIVLGLIAASTIVNAEDTAVSNVSVSVPVACELNADVEEAHNATINPGTYEDEIGTTTFTVFCNDNSGFSIYAIGYSNDEYGNNKLLATIGGTLNPTYDIIAGTGTDATTSGGVSNWAMKINKVTGTYAPTITGETQGDTEDFTDYHTVPDTYTKVATLTSNTDATNGSKLQSTYAAYISGTQPAGTYNGKVKYTLVHPNDASAPIACKPSGTTISTIVCMQDISLTNKTSILASMTEAVQYTLVDKRDGKSYTVAKLKDNNIWMTQNLDHDIDANTTYTSDDTDLPVGVTWTPEKSTYLSGNNAWVDSLYHPESFDYGDYYWSGASSNGSDWDTYEDSCERDYYGYYYDCDESLNPISTYITTSGISQYHLGNYYNWTAAIATNDSTSYGVFNDQTGGYENKIADQSICPAGWTLPKDRGDDVNNYANGSFEYLLTQYGWDNDSRKIGNNAMPWDAPFYIPLGSVGEDGIPSFGKYGGFWMTLATNDAYADIVEITKSGIAQRESGSRRIAYPVRCVTR